LRDTYLKIYNDPVGKEQADFLRRSRFGHQAVELAEKIHGTNSMLITYATANNVLPEVRKFVEGDPKRWKDLEQAYAFVSYDKTPLRDVLDTFDYDGWDGYVRGQDMNVVDAALRKGLEAPTMKK
jgi:hypothetical protein